MTTTEFKAWPLVKAAYQDLNQLWARSKPLIWRLAGILLVGALLTLGISQLPLNALAAEIAYFLGEAGIAYLAAPVYVTLHRFAASGGQDTRPVPNHQDPAARKFWAWTVVLLLIMNSYSILLALTGNPTDNLGAYDPETVASTRIPLLLAYIILLVVSIRWVPLLPMAALDPDNSSLTRAWGLSQGSYWTLLGASFFMGLTILLPAFGLLLISGMLVMINSYLGAAATFVLIFALQVATSVLAVFLATHIYMGLLERLQTRTGSTT